MDSRERVMTALQHEEPDRVPFNLRPAEEQRQQLREQTHDSDVDFDAHFGHDVRYVSLLIPERPRDLPRREWRPNITDGVIAAAGREAQRLKTAGLFTCGNYVCGVFEEAKFWLGDELTLTMPYDDPHRLGRILDQITELKAALYGAYAQAGVDVVWIGDDIGAQRALVMPPEHYRRWYRPRHEQIVAHLRAIRSDVVIAFHACGHVTPIVGDLIEMGIDILEAVQPEAMDLARLKRRFGGQMTFWGGIGTQSVMAGKTPAQVAEGVRQALKVMAPGGGYIAAPCHTLTAEVPWENVTAFYRAVRQYGPCHSPPGARSTPTTM